MTAWFIIAFILLIAFSALSIIVLAPYFKRTEDDEPEDPWRDQ